MHVVACCSVAALTGSQHYFPGSVRQERESPYRPTLRHLFLELLARNVPPKPTNARQYGDVLSALMRVSDGNAIHTGTGLELPHLLSVIQVDRDEFTRLFPREQKPATCRQDGGPDRMISERKAPFGLSGQRIDSVDVPDLRARLRGRRPVLDELVPLADDSVLDGKMLVDTATMHGRRIEEPGFRVKGGMRPILAAARRRAHLDLLAGTHSLCDLGFNGTAGLLVALTRPIDRLARRSRNEVALGAVEHVKKGIAVELHRHLAFRACDIKVSQNQLPHPGAGGCGAHPRRLP